MDAGTVTAEEAAVNGAAADSSANRGVQRNGSDLKVNSYGAVGNLSNRGGDQFAGPVSVKTISTKSIPSTTDVQYIAVEPERGSSDDLDANTGARNRRLSSYEVTAVQTP